MARMVESQPAVLREPDAAYAFPCIADVACRAPAVRITLPDRSVAVGCTVREAEDDVAIDFPEHVKHLPDVVVVQRMPVVFQVVNSPFCPLFYIGLHKRVRAVVPNFTPILPVVTARFLITIVLVVQSFFDPFIFAIGTVRVAADVSGIGTDPRSRVNAHPQAHVVNLARERRHVGKFFVGLNGVVSASAPALPTVVNVDVAPAVVGKPLFNHCACRRKYLFLCDVACPAVPTVPAHRWGESDFVTHDDPQVAFIAPQRIFGAQADGVFSRFLHAAGDSTSSGVEFQSPR